MKNLEYAVYEILIESVFAILQNIVVIMLPVFIMPIFEYIFLHIIKTKKKKENVFRTVMQLTSIYIIYPLVLIMAIPFASIISIVVMNTLVMEIDFSNLLLKIYLIFCVCYIIIYCINKMQLFKLHHKLLSNKIIFIICIVSSLCFSFDYFSTLILWNLFETKQIDYFGGYVIYLEYCGVIVFAIISYIVLCYFLKKAVFIRKKLISYSPGKQKLIWLVICLPLILDIFEIENFHCIFSNMYIFPYFHFFWIVLELLIININIFYIFRPYYAIENLTYYDIT